MTASIHALRGLQIDVIVLLRGEERGKKRGGLLARDTTKVRSKKYQATAIFLPRGLPMESDVDVVRTNALVTSTMWHNSGQASDLGPGCFLV